jgi:hypothetical protein
MPDDIDPVPLPENPSTVAELLPFLPLPYAYAKQWACVFSEELADRLVEVQESLGNLQFRVTPIALTDGRFMIRGAILSETAANGLYGLPFSLLDSSRFDEVAILPWADAMALRPQPDPLPEGL